MMGGMPFTRSAIVVLPSTASDVHVLGKLSSEGILFTSAPHQVFDEMGYTWNGVIVGSHINAERNVCLDCPRVTYQKHRRLIRESPDLIGCRFVLFPLSYFIRKERAALGEATSRTTKNQQSAKELHLAKQIALERSRTVIAQFAENRVIYDLGSVGLRSVGAH